MQNLNDFPHLLSLQSLWLEDGAPSHTARIVVTWQKKHFPSLVGKQAASSPDLSPLKRSCAATGTRTCLRSGHLSCCDTAPFRRTRPTAPPRPSQRGQPLLGPSVLTGHSSLSLEPPAPKSAMINQLASHGVDTSWLLHRVHNASVISQTNDTNITPSPETEQSSWP